MALVRGLLGYGLGGSAASASDLMINAATVAEEQDMNFVAALAHLYAGVLLHKAGAGRDAVEKELKLVINKEWSPCYASWLAHSFLGTEEERDLVIPKVLYAKGHGKGKGKSAL